MPKPERSLNDQEIILPSRTEVSTGVNQHSPEPGSIPIPRAAKLTHGLETPGTLTEPGPPSQPLQEPGEVSASIGEEMLQAQSHTSQVEVLGTSECHKHPWAVFFKVIHHRHIGDNRRDSTAADPFSVAGGQSQRTIQYRSSQSIRGVRRSSTLREDESSTDLGQGHGNE